MKNDVGERSDDRQMFPVEATSLAVYRARLQGCADEEVSEAYARAESVAGRCFLLCCLSVAVLHDRYRVEEWPTKPPLWWNKEKAYPPAEPYWTYSVGHTIERSARTVYRRYEVWRTFEQFATDGNFEQAEEFASALGHEMWGVIIKAEDRQAALIEAVDLKAETGEVRSDMLAARLQERGLLQKAKWEYGCPCGCDWWGLQRAFRKRQLSEASALGPKGRS